MSQKVIEAIRKIYPTLKGGCVYWETKQDLTPWENPIDGLVWENTEFDKPTWKQIEAQFSNVKLEESQKDKINQCLDYLLSTDWYITRMIDPSSSIIVPENILINRANARAWQENIDACTSLEELNAININFS